MRRIAKRCKTDWFRLICDFKKFGLTHDDIYKRTKIPVSTFLGWKQGGEPKHGDGEELIKLWCSLTAGDPEDVPQVDSNSWWSYHS